MAFYDAEGEKSECGHERYGLGKALQTGCLVVDLDDAAGTLMWNVDGEELVRPQTDFKVLSCAIFHLQLCFVPIVGYQRQFHVVVQGVAGEGELEDVGLWSGELKVEWRGGRCHIATRTDGIVKQAAFYEVVQTAGLLGTTNTVASCEVMLGNTCRIEIADVDEPREGCTADDKPDPAALLHVILPD